MNKDKKLVFGVLALLVGIIVISISYAAFTQNLNINGTGNVQATSWSVHFANLSNAVTNGTAVERTAPTIKSGRTDIGDYEVEFYSPGDSITYKFDVVNDGDYDAKISVVTKGTPTCSGSDSTSNTNVCANLEYTLKYTSNNKDVAVNDTLRVNETKNMTLVLRYKTTIGQDELPTATVTVGNLGITLQYSQDSNAGGNPVVAPSYIYYTGTSSKYAGDTLTVNNTDTFDNYSDAVSTFGHPFFTAHIVNGSNEITESYVGFVKDGRVYYLKGGDSGTAYTLNKSTLTDAFGTSNCTGDLALNNINSKKILNWLGVPIVKAGQILDVSCSASGLGANADASGGVSAGDDDWNCYVNEYGDSYCSSR